VSDVPQGPGWWRASNGLYYPPEARPGSRPEPTPEGAEAPTDELASMPSPPDEQPDPTTVEPLEPTAPDGGIGGWDDTEAWGDDDGDRDGRSRGWVIPALIVVAVVAVAAAIGLWLLLGDEDDDSPEPTPTTQPSETTDPDGTATTDETTPTTEDNGEVSVFEVGVGDCFDTTEVDTGDGLVVTTVLLVECDEPHRAEVFAIETIDADPDEVFPGAEARDQTAQELCEPGFAEYVGVPLEESELVLLWLAPTEESWADGDREVACAVAAPGDEPLTESVEGSER
jgi:hypothetical protein